jgi:hypothetical protein
MRALRDFFGKRKLTVWWRAFRLWQRRPFEVAAMSAETHVCASCKTRFQGNYCPRCGQSASVGRFSFVNTFLMLLEVWSVGNRSILRSMLDLMLRPGYMIRDYLSGMRSAYFSPFNMFFLLATFSLIVEQGISFHIDEEPQDGGQRTELTEAGLTEAEADSLRTATTADPDDLDLDDEDEEEDDVGGFTSDQTAMYQQGIRMARIIDMLREQNPALFSLFTLVLFSLPLYFFWRRSPSLPGLRFSEFIVALICISNAYSIYTIAGKLLGLVVFEWIALLTVFLAMKQLTGFSTRRILTSIILTSLVSVLMLAALVSAYVFVLYVYMNNFPHS